VERGLVFIMNIPSMITAVHVFSFLEFGKTETNASLYNDLNICDAADFQNNQLEKDGI
jgi:hypothetical protein